MPEPQWPVGPTFYAQQHSLPPFPTVPEPTQPYRAWGRKVPTQVWTNSANRCEAGVAPPGWGPSVSRMQRRGDISNPWALAWWMHGQGYQPGAGAVGCPSACVGMFSEAGQAVDPYFAELLADRNTPTEARPYLERGEWPPMPGTRTYSEVIKRQFVDRLDEQHYIDWWYAHFTSDAPRYTLPPLPPPAAPPTEPPATEPPGPRPPRDWPAQEPLEEPGEPTVTVTTTGTPTETTERRTPWGWIIGGSAALLLVGGGVAYVVTRPKRRPDGGRRRRRRRR